MATPQMDKYYLRTLHQEIGLYDRKLAHLLKYDVFANEAERTTSASKLKAKRDLLVATAKGLIEQGIEFKASDLPRSLRSGDEEAVLEAAVAASAPSPVTGIQPAAALQAARSRQFASPFAGGVLDGQAIMQSYKKGRSKANASQA